VPESLDIIVNRPLTSNGVAKIDWNELGPFEIPYKFISRGLVFVKQDGDPVFLEQLHANGFAYTFGASCYYENFILDM
jgi:hypothetical protein